MCRAAGKYNRVASSAPSPRAVSGERVGVRGRVFVQRRNDGIENIVCVLKDIVVPKPQNDEAQCLKSFSTPLIIGSLFKVLAAVEFDRQSVIDTGKIQNVAGDTMLSPEFCPELGIAQARPQFPLGVGLCTPKFFRVVGHAPSPCPLPQAVKPLGGEG